MRPTFFGLARGRRGGLRARSGHSRTEGKDQTKNHRAKTPPASAGNRSLNLQPDEPDILLNCQANCPKCYDDIHFPAAAKAFWKMSVSALRGLESLSFCARRNA